jgi:hypothetical protein
LDADVDTLHVKRIALNSGSCLYSGG